MKAENFYESFNGRIVAANLSVLLNSSLSLHICCNICPVYACVCAYIYLCVCIFYKMKLIYQNNCMRVSRVFLQENTIFQQCHFNSTEITTAMNHTTW